MGEVAKKIFESAAAAGKTQKPWLQLGPKDASGVSRPNGPHEISILSEKRGTGTDPFTKQPREELQMVVEEKGVEKMWNVPTHDKDGNLHYLVARLAETELHEKLIVEMKKNGPKSYIDVQRSASEPSVQVDGGDSPATVEGSEADEAFPDF